MSQRVFPKSRKGRTGYARRREESHPGGQDKGCILTDLPINF